MSEKEIKMLVQLREFAIKEFNQIEGKNNSVAQMRAIDAARALSSVVKSLDDVLKNYVEIR